MSDFYSSGDTGGIPTNSGILGRKEADQAIARISAILIGLQTDTPVPIHYLSGFCSHQQMHKVYFKNGLNHWLIDNKTCVRIREFMELREALATKRPPKT